MNMLLTEEIAVPKKMKDFILARKKITDHKFKKFKKEDKEKHILFSPISRRDFFKSKAAEFIL